MVSMNQFDTVILTSLTLSYDYSHLMYHSRNKEYINQTEKPYTCIAMKAQTVNAS